ncbi:MAG: M23 family metallopeptidase [Ruminococcus sp.]|nr:M23 family metallopeptidase [Ruminococcus sp.]
MKSIKEMGFAKLLQKKGLYITLGACLLAVGGAGIAAYNNAVSKVSDNISFSIEKNASSLSHLQADEKTSGVEKDKDSSLSDSSSQVSVPKTQPNVMPVNGEIINPFSNGNLVKSKTLGVWKTHDGIDIKAENGTQVKAMNRGVVTRIWEDALWGNCMTIDHGDGIIGYYYNLAKAMTVIEGDEVDSGEVIGAVGDSAEIEAAEPSHLHFGLKRNGNWIDPVTFINPDMKK